MDGIDPELIDRAEAALAGTPGVMSVPRLQLRWVGHRLGHVLPNLDDMVIQTVTGRPDAHPTASTLTAASPETGLASEA